MDTYVLRNHLEKLYPFKIICDLGSLTAAATTLRLSQSSLSHTIKALEDILEVQLLQRLSRGTSPTAEGEILYEFSKKIFHECDNTELRIKNRDQNFYGVLKVSTHESLATHMLPGFIQRLSTKYPHLKINLISGRIDPIISDVKNANVDIALTVEPLANSKLIKVHLTHTDLAFYVSNSLKNLEQYPALKKKSVSVDELIGIPMLTDTHAHIKQGLPVPNYLTLAGLKTSNSYNLNSFEAAINLCAVGMGICTAPRTIAAQALKDKKIREMKVTGLKHKPFGRSQLHVSYLKESQNRMIPTFIEELKKFIS
jgi:DNA-binding transcriptional LysR family regulator